jgi:hypothetical protein
MKSCGGSVLDAVALNLRWPSPTCIRKHTHNQFNSVIRTSKIQFADAGSAATILKMAIQRVEGFDVLYRRFERKMSAVRLRNTPHA